MSKAELIADIGGSSSRWALLAEDAEPRYFDGLPGYNPAAGDADAFVQALRERFGSIPEAAGAEHLQAYGAGCGAPERKQRMVSALRSVWPEADITVDTDLLGTANGLCDDHRGLVLILGTGMNVGAYDGTSLWQPMRSIGYVLGDEGSGADIGKHVLRDAIYGLAPKETVERLFPEGLDVEEVIERTYRSSSPQAYLASFTARLADHSDDPYVQQLLRNRFDALAGLFLHFFTPEQRTEVFATGSVAWGFRTILEGTLNEKGMQLSAVERDPLRGLVRRHLGLGLR